MKVVDDSLAVLQGSQFGVDTGIIYGIPQKTACCSFLSASLRVVVEVYESLADEIAESAVLAVPIYSLHLAHLPIFVLRFAGQLLARFVSSSYVNEHHRDL